MKKQGRGFLIWPAFLAFFAFYPFLLSPIEPHEPVTLGDLNARTIASAPIAMKFIAIVGGILSIALCYLFFKIAQKKTKRLWYAKIPGFIFFGIGTGFIIQGSGEIARNAFLHTRGVYDSTSSIMSLMPLISSLVFITRISRNF